MSSPRHYPDSFVTRTFTCPKPLEAYQRRAIAPLQEVLDSLLVATSTQHNGEPTGRPEIMRQIAVLVNGLISPRVNVKPYPKLSLDNSTATTQMNVYLEDVLDSTNFHVHVNLAADISSATVYYGSPSSCAEFGFFLWRVLDPSKTEDGFPAAKRRRLSQPPAPAAAAAAAAAAARVESDDSDNEAGSDSDDDTPPNGSGSSSESP